MENDTVQKLNLLIEKIKHGKCKFVAEIKAILERQNEAASWQIVTATKIVEIVASVPNDKDVSVEWTIWLNKLLGKNIDERHVDAMLVWFQGSIEAQNNHVVCSALTAMSVIFSRPNGAQYAERHLEQLFNANNSTLLQRLASDFCEDFGVAVVQCFDALVNCLWEKPLSTQQIEVFESTVNVLLSIHYDNPLPITPFTLNTLTVISKVSTLCPTYAQSHVSELFGLAKAYMHRISSVPAVPQKVHIYPQFCYESAEDIVAPDENALGGKVTKKRKPRAVVKGTRQMQLSRNSGELQSTEIHKMPIVDWTMTSDSDAEIETAERNISKQRHLCAKVRLASITLLGVVARSQERRVLYGYWHALFPSNTSSSNSSSRDFDLLYAGRHDPNARCRSAALQLSAQFFLDSKGFLSQAESGATNCPTSFLPFSFQLGFMLLAIYDALTDILAVESSTPVLIQALQCLAVLLQSTPFHRMQEGFVRRFMQFVRPLVFHRDSTIQVSALMTMEFLVAAAELTAEVAEVVGLTNKNATNFQQLQNTDAQSAVEGCQSLKESKEESCDDECNVIEIDSSQLADISFSWLVAKVLENLNFKSNLKISTAVRIESLQVLTAIAPHILLQTTYTEPLADALNQALQQELTDIRLHAARCLDSYAYQICRRLPEDSPAFSREIAACESFWMTLLSTMLNYIRDSHLTTLCVCLCDAISNMGAVIFARLKPPTQLQLLSFLSVTSSESAVDITVRAATVRALAVFVLFPSLRENLVIVENTAEVTLRLVEERNLLVRIKAFWSMGNISDALISNSDCIQNRISSDLLYRLISAATLACNDNDKVRCNAVRTIGNLLRLLSEQQLRDIHCRAIFQKSVQKLIDCIRSAGSAKVKWNSCYAIGNLMQNRALFNATQDYVDLDWLSSLYPVLCHTIVNHPNFKVRINATVAVGHIEERVFFGSHFETFWSTMLLAIDQSYIIENFYEYNHRDQLQEELCIVLCHLLHCSLLDDMPAIQRHLIEHQEIVQKTWRRVANHMVPEKAAPILACSLLLRKRLVHDLKASLAQAISFIAQVFEVA